MISSPGCLRAEAMKNPMNKADGTWRFIYVNAAGQIIGSVKFATLQQMAVLDLNHGKFPPVAPGAVSASSLASGAAQSSLSGTQGGVTSGPGQLQNPLAALKPTGPVDGPVPGAFLTGVGGKTNAKSLIVYKGGKKYRDWEFIWNPIEDQARAMQQQGGLTNGGLPGLPSGLTGTGNPSSGNTGPSGTPSTSPNAPNAPNSPSNPTGNQPPPSAPQQGAPQENSN
jgi:hypothetical protein